MGLSGQTSDTHAKCDIVLSTSCLMSLLVLDHI